MDEESRFRLGIELFNQGRYWEAHEAWEEAWTPDRRGPEAAFYKGLIQIAAGCLHHRRGNRRGAANKWRGGAAYLRGYAPRHRGIDLLALLSTVEGLLGVEEAGWPELAMPLIEPG